VGEKAREDGRDGFICKCSPLGPVILHSRKLVQRMEIRVMQA